MNPDQQNTKLRSCRSGFILLSCLILYSAADAAPPNVTHLYPAGAQRGTMTDITAGGALDQTTQWWASGKGVAVQPVKDKGKLAITVAADAVPGVYWLRPYDDSGAGPLRPFIVGMLPEVLEQEPNDEPKKPQLLATSCVVNGKLAKANDVDCFAIAAKKGQTLVASLEANRTLKSPMDGVLQLVSADGFVLAQNNDFHGLDPQVAFAVPKDGTYIARVFAFPSQPDSSIRFAGAETYIYRLTLTTEGFADYAFPLAVSRAKPADVDVIGWNIPESLRTLPAAETLFHPKLANPFRVTLEPHPVLTAANPAAVPPFSISGRLEKPGAVAAFPFTPKKGQPLTVQVQSHAFGLPLAPVVRVYAAADKQIVRAEPPTLASDTTLSFTPSVDAIHTVEVTDLYGGGGPRHAFLLRVVPVEPDCELTVAADRFTVTPGKPTTVPVKVVRKNGFTKPVEVLAEGLPESVTVKIEAPVKPDPALVTLSITSEKPVSAPFRLVGRVKEEPPFTRTVRFVPATPDLGEPTADLWLTVLAPPKK